MSLVVFVDRMISRFGRERWNEHVKLAAATLNNIGVASIIGAFVAPLVNAAPRPGSATLVLLFLGMVLSMAGQLVLRYYRGKE